jgi:EthD domain
MASFNRADYAERDAAIRINSYTTVRRRHDVRHELFDAYWRDVHGPLASRVPGLGWYVQHHFHREHGGHLWPVSEDIHPVPDYVLDGAVEIGFASATEQNSFNAASPILFSDEQNVFEETVAYDLPHGSLTLVDRLSNPAPNETDRVDRLHVHFHAASEDFPGFRRFMADTVAATLANERAVLKLRLHVPEPYDNAAPNPPAPDVKHAVPSSRIRMAMLEIAFADPLARRCLFASDAFRSMADACRAHVRHVTAFAVSGVYTYVRDGRLTAAGLRGSRAAALIAQLGAINQVSPEVVHLFRTGTIHTPDTA